MTLIELDISETSKVLAVLGFYIVVLGLGSYFYKERLFISDSMIALAIGIAVGPIGADWFSVWRWTGPADSETQDAITFEIARIVVGIQVLFCGISLPKAYLQKAWKSLTMLIGPVMTCAWLISGGLIYALIPGLSFLDALVISACVAPTDPVLANAIVKGRFAEEHVPVRVRNILAAESGANDGLGVPFIYLAIYLQRRVTESFSVGEAIREWIVAVVLYEICLSVVMGAMIGYVARKTLKFAERRGLIDHESFLGYSVGLTFFTLGVVGMIGSDDLLACFIAGNSFTWDDWFRVETEDHSFQHVIDNLINSAIFIYFGTIIPWGDFGNPDFGLTPGRLVAVAVLILLLRRLPVTLLLFRWMPDIKTWREAGFAGWFGPIGVSAIYYAELALQKVPEDRTATRNVVVPVVYIVILGSVIFHGISIPILKYPTLVASTYSRTNSLAPSFRFGHHSPPRTNTLPKTTSDAVTIPEPAYNNGDASARLGTEDDGERRRVKIEEQTPPSSKRGHDRLVSSPGAKAVRDTPPTMEEREGMVEGPERIDERVRRENEADAAQEQA